MIRLARPGEAARLAALVEAAYAPWVPVIGRRPMPMDDDYAARIAAGEAWVLEEASAIRGLVVIEAGPDHLFLDNIAVDPVRRGTGDGRVLLDFVEAEARRRGLPEVRLYTNALDAEHRAVRETRLRRNGAAGREGLLPGIHGEAGGV